MNDIPREPGHDAGDLRSMLSGARGMFAARRRLFVVTFVCVALAAVAGTYLKRQLFESNARLLVKLDQRDVSLSQAEVRHELAQRVLDEAVGTQAELLRSNDSIGLIVDQLGPDIVEGAPPTGPVGRAISAFVKGAAGALQDALAAVGLVTKLSRRDAAVETVQKNLVIQPVRRAQLIDLSLQTRTPEAARRILDALISQQLAKLAQLDALSERYDFYRKQSTQLAQTLQQSEADLATFKAKNAVIEFQAEKSMLIQKIERLTALLEGVQPGTAVELNAIPLGREAGAGRAEAHGLTAPLPDAGPNLGSNELSQLMSSLNQLKLERARRITLFNADDPRVQELDNQISVGEGILGRQVAQIRGLIRAAKARLAVLDRIEPELRQRQRDVATREENYRTYVKATEDRRIALDSSSRVILQVVEAPSLPVKPVSSRLRLLLAGLVVALVCAIGMVLAVEFGARRTGGDTAGAYRAPVPDSAEIR